jgi:putative toxin-antitoxin system antitoxin component (TIGR02293 family)
MNTNFATGLTDAKAIAQVNKGLGFEEAEYVANTLGISLEKFGALIGIGRTTLYRKKSERFSLNESDRIMRYARLLSLATKVFESEAGAKEWLSTPQQGLGGVIPLEHAQTETGARQIDTLLNQIDRGIAL